MRTRTVAVGGLDVQLVAGAPVEAVNGPLHDALVPLGVALGVLGFGLIAATLVQVRLGLRPLQDLERELAAVRRGRAERLPDRQPEEVRPLVVEMNSLLDQHTANLERARRHVANLAHALKTPLASLTLALAQPGRDSDRSLLALAAAMDRSIRHHLARARTAALGTGARSSLAVEPRLRDHTAAFARIYAGKTVACRLLVPSGAAVACEAQDFDEVVGNLLDNAFKWARATVRIEAHQDGATLDLSFDDDGPGVPPDRIEEVLQPGKRLDETMPGDGFGLSIVRELAELYGGGLSLAAAPGLGGLRATLRLPAAGAAAE